MLLEILGENAQCCCLQVMFLFYFSSFNTKLHIFFGCFSSSKRCSQLRFCFQLLPFVPFCVALVVVVNLSVHRGGFYKLSLLVEHFTRTAFAARWKRIFAFHGGESVRCANEGPNWYYHTKNCTNSLQKLQHSREYSVYLFIYLGRAGSGWKVLHFRSKHATTKQSFLEVK